MILIQETIVSREVLEEQFLCALDSCKGACCWEGDAGAPLEEEELKIIDTIFPKVKPYLSPVGLAAIEQEGRYVYDDVDEVFRTSLVDNGPCTFMTVKGGIAQCGIEQAYNDGVVDFPKPISCHLYPIRIQRMPQIDLDALNYDRWDICSAACSNGKAAQLPIYKFVKTALVRKYGNSFYEELDAVATHLKENNE